jgi:hypothetical protein
MLQEVVIRLILIAFATFLQHVVCKQRHSWTRFGLLHAIATARLFTKPPSAQLSGAFNQSGAKVTKVTPHDIRCTKASAAY